MNFRSFEKWILWHSPFVRIFEGNTVGSVFIAYIRHFTCNILFLVEFCTQYLSIPRKVRWFENIHKDRVTGYNYEYKGSTFVLRKYICWMLLLGANVPKALKLNDRYNWQCVPHTRRNDGSLIVNSHAPINKHGDFDI